MAKRRDSAGCPHERFKVVKVRNPYEVWEDKVCRDCGQRIEWTDAELGRSSADAGAGEGQQ